MYLTIEQYLKVLKRFKKDIEGGKPLKWEDSEDIGNKYNTCTWGLCSDAAEDWQSDELLFPHSEECWTYRYGEKEKTKIVSSKYLGQLRCPLDILERSDNGSVGCFFRCAVFQRRKKPGRDVVIDLYEKAIAKTARWKEK